MKKVVSIKASQSPIIFGKYISLHNIYYVQDMMENEDIIFDGYYVYTYDNSEYTYIGMFNKRDFIDFSIYRDKRINDILDGTE